jgi:hypothetical protein
MLSASQERRESELQFQPQVLLSPKPARVKKLAPKSRLVFTCAGAHHPNLASSLPLRRAPTAKVFHLAASYLTSLVCAAQSLQRSRSGTLKARLAPSGFLRCQQGE